MIDGKIDQIAYYAHNEEQVMAIKKQWGLLERDGWVEDHVVGEVELPRISRSGISRGHLRFNYKHGIGLEILTYDDGPHWHMFDERFLASEIFISHIGMHMNSAALVSKRPHGDLVQTMRSISHTNQMVNALRRKYYYEIIDTRSTLGHYTKCIWRLEDTE